MIQTEGDYGTGGIKANRFDLAVISMNGLDFKLQFDVSKCPSRSRFDGIRRKSVVLELYLHLPDTVDFIARQIGIIDGRGMRYMRFSETNPFEIDWAEES